jgi:hypothetical protein
MRLRRFRNFIWIAVAAAFGLGIVVNRAPVQVQADAPAKPQITNAAGIDSTTIQITFQNFADEGYGVTGCAIGCGDVLRFQIRYHPQSDTSGSQYTYIGPGDADPPGQVIDGCLEPEHAQCPSGNKVEPPVGGFATYKVTGLSPATTYCFAVRSGAFWHDYIGNPSDEYSDFSADECASTLAAPTPFPTFGPIIASTPAPTSTPLCASPPCLIGPIPPIDLSFLSALAPHVAVILSPTPNQLTHDVLINVKRSRQDRDDGVFGLQWSYLQGGTWYTPDSGPLDQIDKSSFPNGVTLNNSLFTGFTCGSQAAPCAFRTWRVRARVLDGFTLPNGTALWSDWVQFRVQ